MVRDLNSLRRILTNQKQREEKKAKLTYQIKYKVAPIPLQKKRLLRLHLFL